MLKDFIAVRRAVVFDGGEFELRGVSLPDVAGLIVAHREAVDRIAMIVRTREQYDLDDTATMIEVVVDVIKESPFLAADLICSCADEPDAFASAFRLPLTVQIEALRVIAELTFADAAALKKLLADARTLLAGMLPAPAVAEAA
jgi:hypothetical protein